MRAAAEVQRKPHRESLGLCIIALLLTLCAGGYVRFSGLGARSLWLDELATWHVSRIDFARSLQWEPELTIPPLYQLCLRALTDDPRPTEWQLRLPAAVCGVAVIAGGFWLATMAGGWIVGVSLAMLLACNILQIEYSREARPYSMLVLGCMLSMALWYRIVSAPRLSTLFAYVVVTTLCVHAHFLTVFTVAAQAIWWACGWRKRGKSERRLFPPLAMLVTGLLCVPVLSRSLLHQSSISRGIGWLEPPTLSKAIAILGNLTFGPAWLVAILLPATAVMVVEARAIARMPSARRARAFPPDTRQMVGLLLWWLACSWLGLLLASWCVRPLMVDRYALPAAVPALLIPLVVAYRLHRWAPLVIAGLFVIGTVPEWLNAPSNYAPGFRELRDYLAAEVDPKSEAVVLAMEHADAGDWAEMERLAFKYYPLDDRPVYELAVAGADTPEKGSVLHDPRPLHIIEFRADPVPLIEAAGRKVRPIRYEGNSYTRLLFEPYRVLEVAPLATEERPRD